jgi:hypothetical protein
MTDSPFIDKIITQCDHISADNKYVVFDTKSKYSKSDRINFYASYKALKKSGLNVSLYKRIFIHYLGGNAVDLILDNKEYAEYYWFFWGADGYSLISDSKPIYLAKTRKLGKEKKPFKQIIKSKLLKIFRPVKKKKLKAVQHVKKCCTWVKEDYELVKSCTGSSMDFFFFSYLSTAELINKNTTTSLTFNERGDALNFLVGNSLNPTNNHIELIDFVKELETSANINTIMPLSYGGIESYKKSLMSYAKSNLKSTHFLDRFLPYDEYMEIFQSIDVAVFFHIRQQGANNALALLWLGKILIMREENTLFMTLKSWGLSVLSHTEVTSLEYIKDYHNKHLNRVEENRTILLKYVSPEAIKSYYANLYK